uniref:(northern house mosquito) hypothetical protein n=1 Tax=Culex pipiens TaxID=7175 RepID=A0A8D8FHR1_CULPI
MRVRSAPRRSFCTPTIRDITTSTCTTGASLTCSWRRTRSPRTPRSTRRSRCPRTASGTPSRPGWPRPNAPWFCIAPARPTRPTCSGRPFATATRTSSSRSCRTITSRR